MAAATIELTPGKKYNVETSDGHKFRAVYMSEWDGISQFVGYRYYTRDIVAATVVVSKPKDNKIVAKRECARCGGSGKYRNYGECYGCGGRGHN